MENSDGGKGIDFLSMLQSYGAKIDQHEQKLSEIEQGIAQLTSAVTQLAQSLSGAIQWINAVEGEAKQAQTAQQPAQNPANPNPSNVDPRTIQQVQQTVGQVLRDPDVMKVVIASLMQMMTQVMAGGGGGSSVQHLMEMAGLVKALQEASGTFKMFEMLLKAEERGQSRMIDSVKMVADLSKVFGKPVYSGGEGSGSLTSGKQTKSTEDITL